MKFLALTLLLIGLATRSLAEEVETPELSEEEKEKIVFTVKEELANEVKGAVETINEVFGNPSCGEEDHQESERSYPINYPWLKRSVLKRAGLQKRIDWGHAAVGALLLGKKRSAEEGTDNLEERRMSRRGWAVEFGKRSNDGNTQEKVINRGHAAVGALLLGKKRSAEEGTDNLENRRMSRRSWGDFFHGAAVVAAFGKRSNDGNTQEADEEAEAEDGDEVEFQADVTKLRQAVDILNAVLDIATVSE